MDNDVVVILTCESDESNTEGSGNDSDSDLDNKDDLVIDDLENKHRDEGANSSEIENSGNQESEGETDEDLLSDYEREERRI